MKRICLSLLCLIAVTLMSAAQSVTCIVLDTAQNLIYDATLTYQYKGQTYTYTTSYDGIVLIPLNHIGESLEVKVTKEFYDPLSAVIKPSSTPIHLIVTYNYPKSRRDNDVIVTGYGSVSKGSSAESSPIVIRGVGSIKSDKKAIAIPQAEALTLSEAESPSANGVSSGVLTAGEVNDFAKWGLWEKVIGGTHHQFLSHWNLQRMQRHTCQVVNTDGYPLANIPVQLLDAKNYVLYSAMTDNTGKAELWGNKATLFRIDGTTYPIQASITTVKLQQPCQSNDQADVFFIVDATGSMGDEIRYLQAEMQDVIRRSQSAVDGLTIRTGALFYRDHSDQYLCRISPLTPSIKKTQKFIDKQEAQGGGDYEEAIPEALMASLNTAEWNPSARARIAFLILDAPCHNDSASLALLHAQVRHAAEMGVRLVPVVCSGITEKGELLLRVMALATNGTAFFLTDHSGIGDTHLKPTTDTLKVEHLNDMMVRTIIEFTRMPDCRVNEWAEEEKDEANPEEAFLPLPTEDLNNPAVTPFADDAVLVVRPNPCDESCLLDLPMGAHSLFLSDMTGKTIKSFGAIKEGTSGMNVDTSYLSTGVYFFRAYYAGRWYTRKIVVRH